MNHHFAWTLWDGIVGKWMESAGRWSYRFLYQAAVRVVEDHFRDEAHRDDGQNVRFV
ncbi:hypothetical protein BH20ACI2_BH20ACI2_13680 [soil metagenome]